MKVLALFILIVLGFNIVLSFYQLKKDALDKIYHTAWQNKANEKYQWKKNRLKVYTDLVYNTKYGAVYEKN